MKIAVNTRFLIKDRMEGIGRFTFEVLKRLVEQHPEHEFIFFFDRPYHDSFVFGPNVTPIVLTPPARHPLLWWWWFEMALPRALRKHQPDIFLSPDSYLSLRTKVKTLLVSHDIAFEHFPEQVPWLARQYYRYFMPRYHRRADHIISVSSFVKKDLINQYKIPGEKIDVACNGCSNTFRPLTATEKEKVRTQYADGQEYFFYVGAVQPRKNVHGLITAFDRFKKRTNSPVKLLIAGRFGWQTGPVKTAYDNARYKDDIVFLGYVDDQALPGLMGSAIALTYVSFFEGFGIPLLEAMHAEVPVITSYNTGMKEVIGSAGKLVDPNITDQIAITMQLLYEDPADQQRLINKGKEQRQKFSWEKATDIVYNGIEKVVGKSLTRSEVTQ